MRCVAVVAALLAMSPHAGAAPPLEFKGAQMGWSQARLKAHFPYLVCRGGSCDFIASRHYAGCQSVADPDDCITQGRAAEEFPSGEIDTLTVDFVGGGVGQFSIFAVNARKDDIAAALTSKYGPPRTSGARSSIAVWSLSDGRIVMISEPTERPQLVGVTFTSTSYLRHEEAESAAKAKAGAKKL